MLRYTQLESLASLPRPLGGGVAEGRRLGGGGALSGALHTLGYYSTDVCLGSPPKRYDLIIDTGSSITAVPCSSCRACGTHRCGVSGRYDLARSQTSKPVGCHSDAALLCESCAANRCGYSVHYTEGSAIRGHVVQDVAHLLRSGTSSRSEQRMVLPVYFGCQTSESGMFFKQEADGILGLQPSRSRSRVPSMLSVLARSSHSAVEAFSLCLSDTAGLFLMGGSVQRKKASTITIPMEAGARARYSLKLTGMRISGAPPANHTFSSFGFTQSALSPTIVDSGTTFVYASTPVFRALHSRIKAQVPELERVANKMCAMMSTDRRDRMPVLQMEIAGARAPLVIRPSQYMVEFPRRNGVRSWLDADKHNFCVAIFDNRAGGTVPRALPLQQRRFCREAMVIGASIMRNREVVFDIRSSTISFTDADCDSATPRTSLLEGGFSFASCPSSENATVPSKSPLGSLTDLLKG